MSPGGRALATMDRRRWMFEEEQYRQPAWHLSGGLAGGISWVCRHDLAEACHLALEHEAISFDVMNLAGHPEADKYCLVARSRGLGARVRGSSRGA